MWQRNLQGVAILSGFFSASCAWGQAIPAPTALSARTSAAVPIVALDVPAAPRVDVTSYPFTPFLFDPERATDEFRSADRRRYRSIDAHDTARVAENIELIADGSSAPANPHRADYGLIVSALKQDFGRSPPPRSGELNGLLVSVRQDGGDSNLLSANGVLVDRGKGQPGYLSSFESISSLYLPGSTVPTQAVNTQIGVLNSRDRKSAADPSDSIGFHTFKATGTGGTAINVASAGGKDPANWAFGLAISRHDVPQLVQSASDASLAIYPFGTSADPFKLANKASAAGGSAGLQVIAPDGRPVITMTPGHDLRVAGNMTSDQAWTTFEPKVSTSRGGIIVTSASGRYSTVGKTTFLQIDISLREAVYGSGAIVIADLPPGAAAKAGIPYMLAGREYSTHKMLIADITGRGMTVTNYDGTYPGGDGYRLVLTGSYESP